MFLGLVLRCVYSKQYDINEYVLLTNYLFSLLGRGTKNVTFPMDFRRFRIIYNYIRINGAKPTKIHRKGNAFSTSP